MTVKRKPAPRRAAPARTVKPAPLAPVVGPGERLFVLSVPFAERGVANASGATWNGALRQTIYVGVALPFGLTPYASPDFSWERLLEDDENASALPVRLATRGMKPRPHQQVAVDRIVGAAKRGYRGFLEADDVGVGKTISSLVGALAVARMRGAKTMLIMCPKGVIPHWRRTLAAILGEYGDPALRIVVINYDQAKKLLDVPASAASAKRARTKNKRIATSGTSTVDWDVVLFDESHRLKNAGSQRSAAASRLAAYAEAASTAPFVIWMSATAGQNPVELGYLSPLLAQLTGSKKSDLTDYGQWLADQGFAVEFNARFKVWQWGLIPDGASPAEVAAVERRKSADLARIRVMLFDGSDAPSIRRLPTDIAGWPEIQRMLHPVALESAERKLYEAAWTEFRSTLQMAVRGRDPKGGMAARVRFRQKSSLIRAAGTVEQVLDLLENGKQVAVSVQWMESIDAIREGLEKAKVNVAEFSGRVGAGVAERERIRFQRGQAQVILFSVTEGVSLHAGEDLGDGSLASTVPRETVVHDPRYSGLDSIQVEGRCHRDGQKANIYYAFAEDTVEEQIVRTLLGRVISTKEMAGDDVTVLRLLEGLLDGDTSADDSARGAASAAGGPAVITCEARAVPAVVAGGAVVVVRPVRGASAGAPVAPARPKQVAVGVTAEERALRAALSGGAARRVPTVDRSVAEREALRRGLAG